jgi:hypothetical protein
MLELVLVEYPSAGVADRAAITQALTHSFTSLHSIGLLATVLNGRSAGKAGLLLAVGRESKARPQVHVI